MILTIYLAFQELAEMEQNMAIEDLCCIDTASTMTKTAAEQHLELSWSVISCPFCFTLCQDNTQNMKLDLMPSLGSSVPKTF